jgi:HAD superfamily hydrolase (TIGR01509 family)
MEKISTVIFDLGRVLVAIDFEAFPNALGLRTAESRAPFVPELAVASRLLETGKITTEEFLDRLFFLFDKRFTRGLLLSAWNEIIREDVPGIAALVARIQQQHHTAILSNTSPSHFEKAEREGEAVRLIPRRFLSYQVGAAKPDALIYRHVVEALGVPAAEVLFIDDLEENIIGAHHAGMNGIIFTDIQRLERDLIHWNILNTSPA